MLPGYWLRVARGRVENRQYWDIQEFDTEEVLSAAAIVSSHVELREIEQHFLAHTAGRPDHSYDLWTVRTGAVAPADLFGPAPTGM